MAGMILALRNFYRPWSCAETRKLSTPGEPKRGIGLQSARHWERNC